MVVASGESPSIKAHYFIINGFKFCLTFHTKNLLSECWVHLNRSVTLSKVMQL